jgi:plastocyanin
MLRLICKSLIACAAAGALMSGWVSGCSKPQDPAAAAVRGATPATVPAPDLSERRVTIDNFAFGPQVLTVAPGTTVTWLNRDDVPHTATSSDSPPKFNSKAIDTDEQFSQVFTRPGTYPYFCSVHPKMTATIIVK